jgi:hypothetical protein
VDVIVEAPQVSSPYVVQSSAGSPYVILASTQGPPGPAGPAGSGGGEGGGSTQGFTAAATISAYTAVAIVGVSAITADSSQQSMAGSVVGISITGVTAGSEVVVQFSGELTYNGWNWQPGKPIFLGVGGLLTQTPPTSGFNQLIGTPVSTTSMFINLQSPILIS